MIQKIIFLILFIFFSSCGTNTDTPVYPFVFLNPVSVPQIYGIIPTDELYISYDPTNLPSSDIIPIKPEFILKYFVTNKEQQFVGYNLYISSTVPSLAETQTGAAVYLENGIQPSFTHSPTQASTDVLIRKVVKNRIPPPGIYPFQKCEIYTFTFRSMLNNGFQSNPSYPVRGCASRFPGKCASGTSCNPTSCQKATCTTIGNTTCATGLFAQLDSTTGLYNCTTVNSSCPVGTDCNPCDTTKAIDINNGCECKSGQTPPGCNL